MNINDSKAIMDKLSSLITAAEEFGNQAEQLANARGDFDRYLISVKSTDEKMVEVIKKCDEYIETARVLVERDLSDQIKEIVESTEASVKECKSQCEKVTQDYKEAVALFEQQKPTFEEHQRKMVATVEAGFEKETATTKEAVAGLEEKAGSLAQSLSESLGQVKSEIATLIVEESEKTIATLSAIKEDNDTLRAELSATKDELSTIKEWQKKNELYIKLGAIAACVAALAAIVGLFV